MKDNPFLFNLPKIGAAIFAFFLSMASLGKLSGHGHDLQYILSGLCFLVALIIAFSKWKPFYVHLIWMLFWAVSMHQLYQYYSYYKTESYMLGDQNEELRNFIRQNIPPEGLKPDDPRLKPDDPRGMFVDSSSEVSRQKIFKPQYENTQASASFNLQPHSNALKSSNEKQQ